MLERRRPRGIARPREAVARPTNNDGAVLEVAVAVLAAPFVERSGDRRRPSLARARVAGIVHEISIGHPLRR